MSDSSPSFFPLLQVSGRDVGLYVGTYCAPPVLGQSLLGPLAPAYMHLPLAPPSPLQKQQLPHAKHSSLLKPDFSQNSFPEASSITFASKSSHFGGALGQSLCGLPLGFRL